MPWSLLATGIIGMAVVGLIAIVLPMLILLVVWPKLAQQNQQRFIQPGQAQYPPLPTS